jgi:hypothetical protein
VFAFALMCQAKTLLGLKESGWSMGDDHSSLTVVKRAAITIMVSLER